MSELFLEKSFKIKKGSNSELKRVCYLFLLTPRLKWRGEEFSILLKAGNSKFKSGIS
jgi:hypothetical protein